MQTRKNKIIRHKEKNLQEKECGIKTGKENEIETEKEHEGNTLNSEKERKKKTKKEKDGKQIQRE